MNILHKTLYSFFIWLLLLPLMIHAAAGTEVKEKTYGVSLETPAPVRFITRGTYLVDLKRDSPVFSLGIGYSPYLPNETPLKGDPPGDDARYEEHLGLIKKDMNVNYTNVSAADRCEKDKWEKVRIVNEQLLLQVWALSHP